MPRSFFSLLVLMHYSGHLQTVYSVLGNFSVVDPVVYDRQVVSHYHTHIADIITTFAGGYFKPKMAGPCQVICFDLEELHSSSQHGPRLPTVRFIQCAAC